MNALFKKLNYKEQKQVFVINFPESFVVNIKSISGFAEIKTMLEETDKVEFAIGFATRQEEVNQLATCIVPKLSGDAVFWICYPKGTSKKHKCDFNRDTGWEILGTYNMETVRQVAIDEDWSALRFRKREFIKSLTRGPKNMLSK